MNKRDRKEMGGLKRAIRFHIVNGPYPFIRSSRNYKIPFLLMEYCFYETGNLLEIKEACDLVEDYLIEDELIHYLNLHLNS